jgi:hypothetical protein
MMGAGIGFNFGPSIGTCMAMPGSNGGELTAEQHAAIRTLEANNNELFSLLFRKVTYCSIRDTKAVAMAARASSCVITR